MSAECAPILRLQHMCVMYMNYGGPVYATFFEIAPSHPLSDAILDTDHEEFIKIYIF